MKREAILEQYNERTHVYGRAGLAIGILMMLALPFAMGIFLNAMPDLPAFWKGFAQVAAIYIPSCVAEFLIYTPMLGSGGSYLAFITGNLINMKIPCMISARDIVGVKAGTPENEIVSTLAIAASALTTIVVITVGVILFIPLRPVLENPVLAPAFDCVVPALFGALAYQYFRKNMKIVAIPLLVMSIVFVLVPSLISEVGFMIMPSGATAIGVAWMFFKKELNQEQKIEEAKAENAEAGKMEAIKAEAGLTEGMQPKTVQTAGKHAAGLVLDAETCYVVLNHNKLKHHQHKKARAAHSYFVLASKKARHERFKPNRTLRSLMAGEAA